MNFLSKVNRSVINMLAKTKMPKFLPTLSSTTSRDFSVLSMPKISFLSTPLLKTITPIVNPVCGLKVKGRLRRRCKDCYFVWREERLYVMCKTHPRHKQMAMKKREYNTWILTDATQSKIRPW